MKRYLFGLALAMAFHQTACSAGNSTTSGTSPEPAAETAAKHADPIGSARRSGPAPPVVFIGREQFRLW
jgi:hypothetical protein